MWWGLEEGKKSADVELLALLQRQQKDWKIEVLGKLYFFDPRENIRHYLAKPIHEVIV